MSNKLILSTVAFMALVVFPLASYAEEATAETTATAPKSAYGGVAPKSDTNTSNIGASGTISPNRIDADAKVDTNGIGTNAKVEGSTMDDSADTDSEDDRNETHPLNSRHRSDK